VAVIVDAAVAETLGRWVKGLSEAAQPNGLIHPPVYGSTETSRCERVSDTSPLLRDRRLPLVRTDVIDRSAARLASAVALLDRAAGYGPLSAQIA
jgi:hypothetical protein